MKDIDISRFMSLVLRHRPDQAGLTLDPAGWADVDTLLEGLARGGMAIDLVHLEEVVFTNDKQRFEFNEDGTKIRARQGHSLPVVLGYPPASPPELLFHGTVARLLPSIQTRGLEKMKRHAVHLSPDLETARRVGARRGTPVILTVKAGEMARAGVAFYHTPNNVWLVDRVPPEFIQIPEGYM